MLTLTAKSLDSTEKLTFHWLPISEEPAFPDMALYFQSNARLTEGDTHTEIVVLFFIYFSLTHCWSVWLTDSSEKEVAWFIGFGREHCGRDLSMFKSSLEVLL